VSLPDVHVTVICSRGTYVRALADDIGRKLGCGAHLAALTRTRIGPYLLSEALTLEEVRARRAGGSVA
jgi:tRNA pseudouridine55 synthase